MSKEAMKLVLEALENSVDLVEEDYANAVSLYGKYPSRAQRLIGMETMRDDHIKAITVLKALADQPAHQEPVAWMHKIDCDRDDRDDFMAYYKRTPGYCIPLYTTPQPAQRKPLTREQVKGLMTEAGYDTASPQQRADFINGIRHGEAAHGIKENT